MPDILSCFRGFVQCLKLSPNLRKQSKDIERALRIKNNKKVQELQVKKLQTILEMVREQDGPTVNDTDDDKE